MKICFIGGGNMATALIGGMRAQGTPADTLSAVELNADSRTRLEQTFGIRTAATAEELVAAADCIVLAVKPQQLREVATDLAGQLQGKLLLSIAAGIRASDIARWSGCTKVVRAMPNTPSLVGAGMAGLFALPAVTETERAQAGAILAATGQILWLEEEIQLDAVTAISGSGPAYVFYFIEALQQAAAELGLSPDAARQLSLATFLGASKLASDSAEDAGVLRARVTSKNGTTERGLQALEHGAVAAHILAAARAAAARAKAMGDELGAAA